jgi:dethiobiotin synthetase
LFIQELYRLQTPASPHIAAELTALKLISDAITQTATTILHSIAPKQLVIEGAGGLLVPINRFIDGCGSCESIHARN